MTAQKIVESIKKDLKRQNDITKLTEQELKRRLVLLTNGGYEEEAVYKFFSELDEKKIKQRLDPKCWTGYHKEGTKIKGGVRVNNCVKNEALVPVAEETPREVNSEEPLVKQMVSKSRNAHPHATTDLEAIALYLYDKENYDVNKLEQGDDTIENKLARLEQTIKDLKQQLSQRQQ